MGSDFLDDTRSGYGHRASGGGSGTSVGGYITNGPSYDRFGRELSNYDKWRLHNGAENLVRDDDSVRYAGFRLFLRELHSLLV